MHKDEAQIWFEIAKPSSAKSPSRTNKTYKWRRDGGWRVWFCPTHTEVYLACLVDRRNPDFDRAELKRVVTADGWDMSDLVAPEARRSRAGSGLKRPRRPNRG